MEQPPSVPDRYALDEPLGHGAMGTVWRAVDRRTGTPVAIKVVETRGPQGHVPSGRFRREAEAAMAVDDPHVVHVLDVGSDERGTAWLVMELLPGPSIAELVSRDGPLPWGRGIAVARGVAQGLAAAHAVGVVHRDIKPSNVVLRGDDPVIVDFGIARLTDNPDVTRTATGVVTGTAAYLAPEQARGEQVTSASDMYAFGCLLTTMFTGSSPFTSEAAIAQALAHVNDPPPRVSDRRPDVPPALDALVARLLAKDPAARPDAAAAVAALAQAGREAGALASPGARRAVAETAPLARLDRMLDDGDAPLRPGAPPRRLAAGRPSRWRLLVPAVALAALLLALGSSLLGRTPPRSAPSAAPTPVVVPTAAPVTPDAADTPPPDAWPTPSGDATPPVAPPPARTTRTTQAAPAATVPASALAGVSGAIDQVGNPGARNQLTRAWADASAGITVANADARVASFRATMSSMPQLTDAEQAALSAALRRVASA